MSAGERREYRGAAAATTLNGAISSGATSITLTDATNWPDGSVGPFYVVIDPGLAAEEKVKCISRTGNTLTVVTSPSSGRGADNTVATTHVSGAAVQHVWTAADADLVNAHVNDQNDNHPSLLNVTRHDTTSRHALGTVIGTGTPGSSAVGDAAAAGVATTASRSDHKHGREAFGTPGASAVGDNTTAGSAVTPARSDHKHGREDFGSAVAITAGGSTSNGTGTTVAHANHTHAAATDVPVAVGTTLAEGAANTFATSNHVHTAPQFTRLYTRTAAALAGTPPAATTGPWLIGAGTSNVSLDGSGNGTVNFPAAFPNGVLTVVITNGDAAVTDEQFVTSPGSTSTTGFGVHVPNNVSTTVRCNWLAVGW